MSAPFDFEMLTAAEKRLVRVLQALRMTSAASETDESV